MSLGPTEPGTMLGLAADEQRREQEGNRAPKRKLLRTVVRRSLATVALMIGLSSFTMGTAQAWIFDDLKDNIASTIVNICGPNDLATPTTYKNMDTLAGLNENPRDGARATVLPDYSEDNGDKGGNATQRLNAVYGENADTIKPTYERYGFTPLRWNQYGHKCVSPTTVMGPLANGALFVMVHMPMMISMAVLNTAMDNSLYRGFAVMMEPFIGAMYDIFNPWIYFIVPFGIALAWVASAGSAVATLKATGWGIGLLSLFGLMSQSTSQIVTFSTNIVTEVAGTAACHISAAAEGEEAAEGEKCDPDDPIKSVNQALWYGVPYQTWLVGQVGEQEAAQDSSSGSQVGWGSALLNGNYVGMETVGEGNERGGNIDMSGYETIDEDGDKVLAATEEWNGAPYTDEGKVKIWGEADVWSDVPALTNVKMLCNDQDALDDDPGTDPSESQRWMFSGAAGEGSRDSGSYYCDTDGAGTSGMVSTFKGEEYNKQFLTALSGMVGVGAVSLTVAGAAIYLAFQKMSFFFLLFLAPVVLTISALGDRKRRPFAIRFAELIGANLLKQVAAVCVVLFVSHAMASLFGSNAFGSVPWVMKPFIAIMFFLALVFLAFPLKNLVKGAVAGDTGALDKVANTPATAVKAGGTALAVTAGVAATGGASAALGLGGVAGAGGKAAALGKSGTMLGQAGRVMGIGSKTGRAMRASGMLMKAGQGVMESQDTAKGQEAALGKAAASLIDGPEGAKYRDKDGKLLPNAKKMAKKDASKLAEAGQKSDRATKAQDQHMAQIFHGYKARTGQFHRDDPESPENQQKARAQHERERLQARSDVKAENATTGTKGDGDNGGGTKGGGGNVGPTTGSRNEQPNEQQSEPNFNQTYEGFRERANSNLTGPEFAREMDYNIAPQHSGEEVLRKAGLTKEEVTKDPTTLLRGEAYEGGSTTKMDPFHPATSAMNELRFASSSGDEDAMESAVAKASDAVNKHGVPDQLGSVNSIGERAKSFEGIELIGAMPTITQETSWSERAEGAQTMMAAQIAMPEGYQGREAVQDYTAALANPGVDPTSLEAMKISAMDAVNAADVNPTPTPTEGGTGGGDGPNTAAMAGAFTAGTAMNNGGGEYTPAAPHGSHHPAEAHQAPVDSAADTPHVGGPPAPLYGDGSGQRLQEDVELSEGGGVVQPSTDRRAAFGPAHGERVEDGDAPVSDAGYSAPVDPTSSPDVGQAPAERYEASEPSSGTPGDGYTAQGPSEVTYTGPSNVAYTGPVTSAEQGGGGGFVEPSEAPHVESSHGQAESASSDQGGGVSREELREAVSDGLRESRVESSGPADHGGYVEQPHMEQPPPPSGDDVTAAHPSPPHVPSGNGPSGGNMPHVDEASSRSAGNSHGDSSGTGPAVEPIPEDEGIFFRPPPRRKNKDEDDEEESEED